MRMNILIAGGLVSAVSVLLLSSEIVASFFGFALGGLNIITGVLTPKAGGIVYPTDQRDPLKLSLDKGVIRTSIYTIAFSDKKLVLRKLSSVNLTVATALILALLGWDLAGPFGIIVGGITAFSSQEFLTQRRRDGIRTGNLLELSDRGDLEFPYEELDQVQLSGNRIQLYLKDRIVRIVISRKYSSILGPVLEKVIPANLQSGPVPSERAL